MRSFINLLLINSLIKISVLLWIFVLLNKTLHIKAFSEKIERWLKIRFKFITYLSFKNSFLGVGWGGVGVKISSSHAALYFRPKKTYLRDIIMGSNQVQGGSTSSNELHCWCKDSFDNPALVLLSQCSQRKYGEALIGGMKMIYLIVCG